MNLSIGPTHIEDTFAEAFEMSVSRVLVTSTDDFWLDAALREFTGYGSSVIGCDAEIAVERMLSPEKTPDGRAGASVLVFGFSSDGLTKAIAGRVGQCLMTCPTSAVFDGLSTNLQAASATSPDQKETPLRKRIPLGKHLRYFGDGFQKSKVVAGQRFWRVPVMDGEFLIEDTIGVQKGIGGGNLILQGVDPERTLAAARRAAEKVQEMPNVISPFAGGVVRSGSKVGSRYKSLKASTADAYCPTLRGRVETKLKAGVNCAYEMVIDGLDFESVAAAMKAAMHAAAGEDVMAITAGNYGGNLGKHHFHLKTLLD